MQTWLWIALGLGAVALFAFRGGGCGMGHGGHHHSREPDKNRRQENPPPVAGTSIVPGQGSAETGTSAHGDSVEAEHPGHGSQSANARGHRHRC